MDRDTDWLAHQSGKTPAAPSSVTPALPDTLCPANRPQSLRMNEPIAP